VGPRRHGHHARAEPPEDARPHAERRAVRAVDDHGESGEVQRETAREEVDVVLLRAVVVDEAADVGAVRARRHVRRRQPCLDLLLPRVGELRALRREELDAVVLERVVGGGEHDAAVGIERAREERDARRREHADRVAVGAGGEETRHHGRLEQRPREARVAADHESHPLAALLRDQRGHELAADAIREVRRQRRLVGHTADAVRAEQTIAHRSRRISTVTCTVLWVVGYTESGRSSPTVRVTLWRRPVTSTGAVSTVARSSIVVRGPFTWTVGGSTTTRPSWTSGGGEPRSCGTTRSARVAAVATATRTQFGETRTTLMPAGACTSSAESCSVLSPSRARERRQHQCADEDGGPAGRARKRRARSQPRQNAGTPSVLAPSSVSRRRRSPSGPASASMPPSTARERRPVSSETTTATASVSSV